MTPRNTNEYIATDLAVESAESAAGVRGIELTERTEEGFDIVELAVTDAEGAVAIGRPVGKYLTMTLGKSWYFDDARLEAAERVLGSEIRTMARRMARCDSVLVVGLGNRGITADALGPKVADGLLVTRHIRTRDEQLYNSLGQCEVSALATGVLGQTGIETLELVKGAVERVRPDLVIAVDALAARGVDRLAVTVQLCDTGLSPGSGIGNDRRALNAETLGVPVLAVGAPTVVGSSTLVRDALSLAGMDGDLPAELEKVLENGRSFFVSLKESDIAVAELSRIISQAINRALAREDDGGSA